MRLTLTHSDYWLRHHAPRWAKPVLTKPISVHACINGHAGVREPDYIRQAGNTVRLVKSMARRDPLRNVLRHLSTSPAVASDSRRMARCKQWLRRLERLPQDGGVDTPTPS